jgi:hypothetical protein
MGMVGASITSGFLIGVATTVVPFPVSIVVRFGMITPWPGIGGGAGLGCACNSVFGRAGEVGTTGADELVIILEFLFGFKTMTIAMINNRTPAPMIATGRRAPEKIELVQLLELIKAFTRLKKVSKTDSLGLDSGTTVGIGVATGVGATVG